MRLVSNFKVKGELSQVFTVHLTGVPLRIDEDGM